VKGRANGIRVQSLAGRLHRDEFLRGLVEGIGTYVLLMRPDDGAAYRMGLLEVAEVSQFLEDAEIQERGAVKDADFSVGEGDLKLVVVFRNDCIHSGIHSSPQGIDLERLLTVYRKLPVRQELIPKADGHRGPPGVRFADLPSGPAR